MAKDFELYERAEELYIVDGLTLEQVSKMTGASTSVIEKWSAENGWKEARREYRRAIGDIKRKTVLLKKRLVDKALDTLDPQIIYALSRVMKATSKIEEHGQIPADERDIKEIIGDIIEAEYGIKRS